MRSPKRPMNDSDEGVSATVGTIMALMVFMFLFGMIQNQYVPVAMKDAEANHMRMVESQFGTLKEKIDTLIMLNAYNYSAYSPITMGSDGIPVFAAQTPGFLSFQPNKELVNVTYVLNKNVAGTITTTKVYGNTSGELDLYVPNRYYIPQRFIYACGAVILYQDSGAVMKAEPGFSIVKQSGDIIVYLRTVRLIGEQISKSGTSTEGVHSSLLYTYSDEEASNRSEFVNSTLWINITSSYSEAWETWFNTVLPENGLINGTDFTITKTLINSNYFPNVYQVSVKINDVLSLSMKRSLMTMSTGEA